MSIVSRISSGIGPRAAAAAGDGVHPGDTRYPREAFFAGTAKSGKLVTADTALAVDAFWAGVRVLSDAVGALPFKTYRKSPGGRAEVSNRTSELVRDSANPEMTAIDLWSLMLVHLNVWGNGYLGKVFNGRDVVELWPIRPDLVRVKRVGGLKQFRLRDSETNVEYDRDFTARDIIHVKGMSLDGLMGLSPISYHRETIGKALAQDEFGNRFYANSAVPRGVLEVDGELDDDAFDRLKKSWNRAHRGLANAFNIAILESGAKFQPISMPLDDAQYVQQQNLSARQMARILRIPASLIDAEGGGSSLTYRTIEGDGIHFERYSVNHWLVRLEQAIGRDRDLYPGGPDVYPQFYRPALLRADSKARAEVWKAALHPTQGWMSRDEVREAEDLPPEQLSASPQQVKQKMAALIAGMSRNGGSRDAVGI